LSTGFLDTRVARFRKDHQIFAALDEIRLIRSEFASQLDPMEIASDEMLREGLALMKERPPFADSEFMGKLNWKNYSEAVGAFIQVLMDTGLQDGTLKALLSDLKDEAVALRLCRVALDWRSQDFAVDAARYGIEPDLLRLILMTPLLPVYRKIASMIPESEEVRRVTVCRVCGSPFSVGVYQGGLRFVMCSVCASRSLVDPFFCPRCGNTDPQKLEFIRVQDEPALELDICWKCDSYTKAVHEELIGAIVEDPILLDLSTMDLDALAKEKIGKGHLESSSS